MKLSRTEEELMNILWDRQPALMKELIAAYPEPKPAQTTIATLLKRMTDKGFVGYTTEGRSRRYHSLVDKKNYFSTHVQGLIKNFFGNSASQFASFFTKETNLSRKELEELRSMIDEQLKNKK